MKKRINISHSETCAPSLRNKDALQSVEAIVDDHITQHRTRTAREMKFYKIQPNLEQAIEVASLAKLPSGKRHPHQRRIPQAALQESKARLSVVDFNKCASFDELYAVVERQIDDISGIGRLTVYDTAQRIGAYLGLEPDLIYLHAGTREGAKALGLDVRKHALTFQEMPEPFHRLRPYEIEDCLCLYKGELSELYRKAARPKS